MTSSDAYFPFLTPAEIYRQLREGEGLGSLTDAQFNTQMELPEETDRADLIASLSDLIATGWQGEASAAARGAALPLRDRVLANADKLDQVQDLLSRQAGSFERAYHSVRPVSEPPEQPLDDAFPFDMDYEKQVAEYQADAQHNIAVFRDYDGASEYNETNMPQEFHAGGRDGGDVSVRSADFIEVGEPRPGGGEPGDGSPGGGRPEGGRGPGGGPGSSGAFPGAGPSSGEGSGVGDGGFSGAGGVTETSGVSPSEGLSAGGGDFRPASGPGSSSFAGSGEPGGFVGGGSGGGPGSGAGGGGAPRGGSAGGASGGPALRGPGGSVGVGGLAAEESAVRRGVAAAGSRGAGGAFGAPLGAGRSQGDEDSEYERKVLIEGDSEEMFGSDVLTAPQVIGDDEYED